jgi:mannitol-specific phosphotransferase system IIBC component
MIAGTKAGKEAVPIRFVHIGAVSGRNIMLPSAALRSSAIQLMGSGIGSIPMGRILKSIDSLLQATIPGGFQIVTEAFPLGEVEHVWSMTGSAARAVFNMA